MRFSVPKPLIIVGAGGLGAELLGWVLSDPSSDIEWRFAGYLDDRPKDGQIATASTAFRRLIARYSSLDELRPLEGKYFLIAIKNSDLKKTMQIKSWMVVAM